MVVITYKLDEEDIQMQNLILSLIFEEVKRMQTSFNSISFSHVYRELNTKADALSKEELQLDNRDWTVLESKDGQVHEYSLAVLDRSALFSPDFKVLFYLIHGLLLSLADLS
jgi:hypothetical protein